jgi:hypothetical protein
MSSRTATATTIVPPATPPTCSNVNHQPAHSPPQSAAPNAEPTQHSPSSPVTLPVAAPISPATSTTHGSIPSTPTPVTPSPSGTTPTTSNSSSPPASSAAAAQALQHPAQQRRAKTFKGKARAFKSLSWAALLVGLVDGLALSARSPYSPLGRLSVTNGILVLSILGMLTGYALAAAAQTAWERFRMKKLSKSQVPGQSLLAFWTLSAEIGGSCLILWRGIRKIFPQRLNTSTIPPRPVSLRTLRGQAKLWSLAR